MWCAIGEYVDGTRIEKNFPYWENDNYLAENERQYELENWIINAHDNCIFYSVNYVEE